MLKKLRRSFPSISKVVLAYTLLFQCSFDRLAFAQQQPSSELNNAPAEAIVMSTPDFSFNGVKVTNATEVKVTTFTVSSDSAEETLREISKSQKNATILIATDSSKIHKLAEDISLEAKQSRNNNEMASVLVEHEGSTKVVSNHHTHQKRMPSAKASGEESTVAGQLGVAIWAASTVYGVVCWAALTITGELTVATGLAQVLLSVVFGFTIDKDMALRAKIGEVVTKTFFIKRLLKGISFNRLAGGALDNASMIVSDFLFASFLVVIRIVNNVAGGSSHALPSVEFLGNNIFHKAVFMTLVLGFGFSFLSVFATQFIRRVEEDYKSGKTSKETFDFVKLATRGIMGGPGLLTQTSHLMRPTTPEGIRSWGALILGGVAGLAMLILKTPYVSLLEEIRTRANSFGSKISETISKRFSKQIEEGPSLEVSGLGFMLKCGLIFN